MTSRNSTPISRHSSANEAIEVASKNTLMRRQFDEFRGKLETGSNNFSKETLHYWLKTLTDKEEISYQNKFVTSLAHLRKLVDWVTGRYKHNKKRNEKDLEMLQYFEWFFGYIEYLRELQRSFENRIYNPLFDYFFDDEEDFRKEEEEDEDEGGDGKGSPDNRTPGVDSGLGNETIVEKVYKQSSVSQVLVQLSREFSDVNFKLDNKELRKTARELHALVKKWRGLIESDRVIDAHFYSKESLEEVARYSNIGNFRQFLRLVPDVLYKARTALSTAERWMDLDDQKLREVDKHMHLVEEIQTRLELRIIEVLSKIQRHQAEFDAKSDELQMLLHREDRSQELNARTTFIQSDINSLCDTLRDAFNLKDELLAELQRLKRAKMEHTDEYSECTEKYNNNEQHIHTLESRLQLERYKYRLVEEDMLVELEVKPSIVRYTNQVEEQCERLEQYLKDEKAQRRKLEKAMKPLCLKTGRDVSEVMNIVDSLTSASQSTADLQAASATSSNLRLNEKSKDLESVYEDDASLYTGGGAVTPGVSLPPLAASTEPHHVHAEQRNEDTPLPPVKPEKKSRLRYDERERPKRAERERGKVKLDEREKENRRALPASSDKTQNSKIPVAVKSTKKEAATGKDKNGGAEKKPKQKQKAKDKPIAADDKPAKAKNGQTKTIVKKPIAKPRKKRRETPKKKVPPKPQRPPMPENEPKVELPWYRRQIVLERQQRQNRLQLRNARENMRESDREPIRSRDNLEWMYRQAAERQGAEYNIISGSGVALQQRYPRPPSRHRTRGRKMPSGLSFL